MKKTLLLLLCLVASIGMWATQYCGDVITSNNSKEATLSCYNPESGKYIIEISSSDENFTGLMGDNMFCYINGSTSYHMTDNYTFADGKVTFTISSSTAPKMYTPIYLNINNTEQTYTVIQNQDIDWPTTCASSKTASDLSVSPTVVTLDLASDTKTSQITYSSSVEGGVTYSSSKESVATVSDEGLITAVGVGTATITVKQAATDAVKEGSKTIAVTVTNSAVTPKTWFGAITGTAASKDYKVYIAVTKNVDNTLTIKGCLDPESQKITGIVYPYVFTPNEHRTTGSVSSFSYTTTETYEENSNINISFKFEYSGGALITNAVTYTVGVENDNI